jgi:hypothetical protein
MEPEMQKTLITDTNNPATPMISLTTCSRKSRKRTSPLPPPGRARNIIWLNNGVPQVRRGRFGGHRGGTHSNIDHQRNREQATLESTLCDQSGDQQIHKGGHSGGTHRNIDHRRNLEQERLHSALSELNEALAEQHHAAQQDKAAVYSAWYKKVRKALAKKAQPKSRLEQPAQHKKPRKARPHHVNRRRQRGDSFDTLKALKHVPAHKLLIHFKVERVAIVDGKIVAIVAPRSDVQHVN